MRMHQNRFRAKIARECLEKDEKRNMWSLEGLNRVSAAINFLSFLKYKSKIHKNIEIKKLSRELTIFITSI